MNDYDDRLLIKPKPKSGAEREARRRSGRTPEQVEKESVTGAEREARRRSGRTPGQVEKEGI